MIRTLHIVAITFAALMGYLTVLEYHRKKMKLGTMLFWCVVWIGVTITTLLFDWLRVYADALQVRVFDLVVVLAFLLTFAVLYRLYGKLEQLGGKMEEIVQAIALRDAGVKITTSRKKR